MPRFITIARNFADDARLGEVIADNIKEAWDIVERLAIDDGFVIEWVMTPRQAQELVNNLSSKLLKMKGD